MIRHGETEWALAGRHTSSTDLPWTENGRQEASLLQSALKNWSFEQVFTSLLKRARETCELAGKPAPQSILVNVAEIISAYYTRQPDACAAGTACRFRNLRPSWQFPAWQL